MYDLNKLTEDDIDNMTPEQKAELSEQLDEMETGGNDGIASPSPEKKDSTLVLFREIIKTDDTTKLGFLRKEELGNLPYSVRKLKAIALFADTQNLIELGEYFDQQAEIVLASSLSFRGKLIDNIITQIKKDMKVSSQPTFAKSGGWFSKKTTTMEPTGGEIQ